MIEYFPGTAPTTGIQENRSDSFTPEQKSLAINSTNRKTIELNQQELKARLEYLDRLVAVSQAVMESTGIQVQKNPKNVRMATDLNIGHTITIRIAINELADDIGIEMTRLKFEHEQLTEIQLEFQKGFPLTKVTGKEGKPLNPEALDKKLEWDIYCGQSVRIPEHDKPKTSNLLVKSRSIQNKLSNTSDASRGDTATTTAVQPPQLTKRAFVPDQKVVRWDRFRRREDIYYVFEATQQAKDESEAKSRTITRGHIIPDSAITKQHGGPLPQEKMAWKCKSLHITRDGTGMDAYMDSTYKTCVLCETSRVGGARLNGTTMDFGFSSKIAVLQIKET